MLLEQLVEEHNDMLSEIFEKMDGFLDELDEAIDDSDVPDSVYVDVQYVMTKMNYYLQDILELRIGE